MSTNIGQILEEKLKTEFSPAHLLIENQSEKHSGHAGDNGTGQTHFHVMMVSDCFVGLNRIARHRLVHAALDDAFAQGLHALSLALYTQNEYKGV